MQEPLAVQARPHNIVENGKVFSMILYGKPGIGKTTIAGAIVEQLGLKYRMLNAVINTKKDFDTVVAEAKMYNGMVVVMDEIHRLNKDYSHSSTHLNDPNLLLPP